MTFNHAYQKLTLLYVLIVMFLSIVFSVVIYHTSSVEISRGLGRQTRFIHDLPMMGDPFTNTIQELEQNRIDQIDESNNHLRDSLIILNFIILAASGALSYFFAKRTLKPIEEMVEAQNRFTADASHELRTPLTAMRSEIEVNLRDAKLSLPEAKELLTSNLEEIAKLEVLSNALLKLAKFQDDVRVGFEAVSVDEVIQNAWKKVESLAKEKSIILSPLRKRGSLANKEDPRDLAAASPKDDERDKDSTPSGWNDKQVLGDKQSLAELFVILFDNAIKYSPANRSVEVTANEHGHQIEIIVKDHGIGMKQSDIPFIFNRFFRADNSRTKEKTTGYGLGLAIAKQIIELHAGSIAVESSPNTGSTFTVSLPAAPKA